MESGFVLEANRHQEVDGRVPRGDDPRETSQARGRRDGCIAVGSRRFRLNALLAKVTDRCHADSMSATGQESLPSFANCLAEIVRAVRYPGA